MRQYIFNQVNIFPPSYQFTISNKCFLSLTHKSMTIKKLLYSFNNKTFIFAMRFKFEGFTYILKLVGSQSKGTGYLQRHLFDHAPEIESAGKGKLFTPMAWVAWVAWWQDYVCRCSRIKFDKKVRIQGTDAPCHSNLN